MSWASESGAINALPMNWFHGFPVEGMRGGSNGESAGDVELNSSGSPPWSIFMLWGQVWGSLPS